MAVAVPSLKITNLLTNAVVATAAGGQGGDLFGVAIQKRQDGPWHVHIELAGWGVAAANVAVATGGPAGNTQPIPLLGELSLDGGATVDCRLVIHAAQRILDPAGPKIVIDQDCLFGMYNVTAVDRVTFVGSTAQVILNAPAGTVLPPVGNIGTNTPVAYVKGLYQIAPGLGAWGPGQLRLKMSATVDPILASQPLSVDINSDTIARATATIAARLAGVWLPADTAPIGSRGHFTAFTGDGARNPTGIGMTVHVGYVGTAIRTTFLGDISYPLPNYRTTSIFPSTGMTVEPQLDTLYAQASFIGGRTNVGLGDKTKISSAVCINTNGGGTAWDASLCIVGTTAGVYYYSGFEYFVPWSQPMVVNGLAYSQATGTIYAATDSGVFYATGSPPSPKVKLGKDNRLTVTYPVRTWQRLGGVAAPVEDVWIDGANVLARVGSTTKRGGVGVDGVYLYPAISGDATGATRGYSGWTRAVSGGAPIAAGGSAAYVYYADRNKPGTPYRHQPGTAANGVPVAGLGAGQNVTAINSAPGYTYIITDAGSAGIYALANGSSVAVSLNGDLSLKDPDTSTTAQVRRIVWYGGSIDGEYVAIFAVTDSGIYRSGSPTGGGWRAPNQKSGLNDLDLSFLAAGRQRTLLGRTMTHLYAGNDRAFLQSSTKGNYWRDIIGAKLSLAPYFAALAQLSGATPWPDGTIGALGTAGSAIAGGVGQGTGSILGIIGSGLPPAGNLSPSGPADTGGTGTVLAIAADGRHPLPAGWIWARRLDEHNDCSYRLVNLNSTAPMAGIQLHELPNIEANADVGVLTASEQIALIVWRWLAEANILQTKVTINTAFTQSDDPLRDLAPGDKAAVTYNPAGFLYLCAMTAQPFYVVSHDIKQDGGLWRTTTVLGTTRSLALVDISALAADSADRISKRLRYGTA